MLPVIKRVSLNYILLLEDTWQAGKSLMPVNHVVRTLFLQMGLPFLWRPLIYL
jgi:hypothetical protein